MDTTVTSARAPEVIAPGSGNHFHFLDHLASVKVAADGERSMSVVRFEMAQGFGPPLHRHEHEDELFIVVDGALRFFTGQDTIDTEAGGIAYLPAAAPHTFQVLSSSATIINVCASRTHVPRFDEMVAALGVPLAEPVLPPDIGIDPDEVARVCAEHDITILGPPPAPLA